METYHRPSWDEYFLDVMHALAKRATCDRGRTACVIVKDNQIVVSGYVGSPPGLPHCDDVLSSRKSKDVRGFSHAQE